MNYTFGEDEYDGDINNFIANHPELRAGDIVNYVPNNQEGMKTYRIECTEYKAIEIGNYENPYTGASGGRRKRKTNKRCKTYKKNKTHKRKSHKMR